MTIDLSQFDGMTPGPWVTSDGGHSNYVASVQATSVRGNAYNIAMLKRPRVGDVRTNARAIASVPDLIAEVRELRAKLAAAEADARRYRALRDLPELCLGVHGIPCIAIPSDPNSGDYVTGQEADAAVDSAIAGGAP